MRTRFRQSGAALIALVAVLVIAVTAGIISIVNAALSQTATNRTHNAAALQEAKSALIGYVVKEVLDLSNSTPGRLPCPESPGDAGTSLEGRAGSSCAPAFPANKTVGRLPWRTLGIEKLVDSASEPLWYAVSPNWVLSGTTPQINPGTTGELSVDGATDVVAIIIAPGPALSVSPSSAQSAAPYSCAVRVQARNDRSHVASGGDPDYRDYLECLNATHPPDATFGSTIVDNATSPVLNDQMVYVTAKDILNAIQGPVAERMQRTVAPLLSEYADLWVSGQKRLPYAFAFKTPEANTAVDDHCGPTAATQQLEGLLPVALSSGGCVSEWNASLSGSGFTPLGCSSSSASSTCSFRYYRLTGLGQFLLGITGLPALTANVTAVAPHATASFRAPITQASLSTSPSATTSLSAFSLTPQSTGDVDLSVQVQVTGTNLCQDGLLPGLVCSTLTLLGLATSQNASVTIPQLAPPLLTGSQLTASALNGSTTPFDLLNPAATNPHYWFMQNEWYRYSYYAVAPSASFSAGTANLLISDFPAQFGAGNDKRFVLALMGPAVAGQSRGTSAAMDQYVEGANAVTTSAPRAFSYQVFGVSGNDRIATCPFTTGATALCN